MGGRTNVVERADPRARWVRNLEAGGCTVVPRDGLPVRVTAEELEHGAERDAVLAASARQPAPAGLVYRLAARHVAAAGRCFRLTPVELRRDPVAPPSSATLP
jgi:hypothetical protein